MKVVLLPFQEDSVELMGTDLMTLEAEPYYGGTLQILKLDLFHTISIQLAQVFISLVTIQGMDLVFVA